MLSNRFSKTCFLSTPLPFKLKSNSNFSRTIITVSIYIYIFGKAVRERLTVGSNRERIEAISKMNSILQIDSGNELTGTYYLGIDLKPDFILRGGGGRKFICYPFLCALRFCFFLKEEIVKVRMYES